MPPIFSHTRDAAALSGPLAAAGFIAGVAGATVLSDAPYPRRDPRRTRYESTSRTTQVPRASVFWVSSEFVEYLELRLCTAWRQHHQLGPTIDRTWASFCKAEPLEAVDNPRRIGRITRPFPGQCAHGLPRLPVEAHQR